MDLIGFNFPNLFPGESAILLTIYLDDLIYLDYLGEMIWANLPRLFGLIYLDFDDLKLISAILYCRWFSAILNWRSMI